MKTIAVTYPSLKRDRDGKFIESQLNLIAEDEFISGKFIQPKTNVLRNKIGKASTDESKKNNYITF